MIEATVLGIIQGITEWLPVSSEGLLVLVQVRVFGSISPVAELIEFALFLHLGTFFAALVYFRKDVIQLLRAIPQWKITDNETRKTFQFLFTATLVSAVLGGGILFALHAVGVGAENAPALPGRMLTFLIGIALLITAYLQLKARKTTGELKGPGELTLSDGLLLGVAQGVAVLPGISRSGITVAGLLMQKFDDATALRLSFLMSLPIVLAGNIVLNFKDASFDATFILGLLFSFVFGLITIHWFLKLAQKINFGYFVLLFALVTLGSVFI